jgi:eukaryotic-like serine/threonine-protein kinase
MMRYGGIVQKLDTVVSQPLHGSLSGTLSSTVYVSLSSSLSGIISDSLSATLPTDGLGGGLGCLRQGVWGNQRVVIKTLPAQPATRPSSQQNAAQNAAQNASRVRFLRELEISRSLEHPNIVRCLGVVSESIIYEYLEGGSLRDKLKREHKLSIKRALQITRGLLSGVAYAHTRGIHHLDLKPENVMLCSSERVKIIDFGLAKDINRTAITNEGDRLGTPHYMAPEQFHGRRNEPRSDLYSIAAILFEMITGKPPYPNPFGWLIGTAMTLTPFSAPEPLKHFIVWGLSEKPDQRPCTALEYLVALEQMCDMLNFNV